MQKRPLKRDYSLAAAGKESRENIKGSATDVTLSRNGALWRYRYSYAEIYRGHFDEPVTRTSSGHSSPLLHQAQISRENIKG